MPFLIVRSGARAGERIELTGELVVGREHADLTLTDEEVSRRPISVRLHEDGVELEDLGSTNGTFVDGARLEASVVISESARVTLGETELEIELEPPAPPDANAMRLHARRAVPDATTGRDSPIARPGPPPTAPVEPARVARAEPLLAAPT